MRPAKALANDPKPEKVSEQMTDSPSIVRRCLADLFGEEIFQTEGAKWYFAKPAEKRELAVVLIGACLMFLPMLGAVGLWDPWESQFAEVGRQMMVRNDWVHPFWEKAPFYSKPPLTMWLTNLGLWLSGASATAPNQPLGIWGDWGARLPVALLAALSIGLVYLASARLFGRRVGLVAALAGATMPLYDILARQAITDTPFVSLLTIAMCCFLIAEFDPSVKNRDPWLFAFYGCVGLSTLAKEIPFGLGIPGGVVLCYLIVTGDWALLKRVRLITGGLFCLLIALPWVVVMSFTTAVEEEGETFVHRYWLHDNFSRLLSGVHTTSPNATFVYYIEQLGYSIHPWEALVPGAMALSFRLEPEEQEDRAKILVAIWALVPFLVISLAATKFEHYGFPCLPPLAILIGLFVDELWREGLKKHMMALLFGGGLFAMVSQSLWLKPKLITELFTYNPDRPYPNELVASPWPVIWALVGVGGVLALAGVVLNRNRARWAGLITLGLGLFIYVRLHLGPNGWSPLVLSRWAPKDVMGGIFLLFGALAVAAALGADRQWFLAAVAGCGIAFGGYLSWVHWEDLAPHWHDRDILQTYFNERKPGEPLGAYLMNWKGETYYGKNVERQIQDPKKLREFLQEPGGANNRHWIITDTRYYKPFLQMMESEGHRVQIRDDSSVKFYLVTVD